MWKERWDRMFLFVESAAEGWDLDWIFTTLQLGAWILRLLNITEESLPIDDVNNSPSGTGTDRDAVKITILRAG
jgi:hypothetical protein